MFIAKTKERQVIDSIHAERGVQYFCVECGGRVSVRISQRKRPYFAHITSHQCGGEGELHKQIKATLRKYYANICFEKDFGNFRADAVLANQVIEIQLSSITERTVHMRKARYGSQLHWLVGEQLRVSQLGMFSDSYGRVYQYKDGYCLVFENIHILTKQNVLYVKKPIAWSAFVQYLTLKNNYCLTVAQFQSGLDFFNRWKHTYSIRYSRVNHTIAQALYRWGIRSEQLPLHVGIPIPLFDDHLITTPVIQQGECCYKLSCGQRILLTECTQYEYFYLLILSILGICQKNADCFETYQRLNIDKNALYQAYLSVCNEWTSHVEFYLVFAESVFENE